MNSPIKFNLVAFRKDQKAVTLRIVVLKRCLGRTWTKPMATEQRELLELKQRATQLCAFRAHTRGRLHRKRPPRGHRGAWDPLCYQERIALRWLDVYAADLEQSA